MTAATGTPTAERRLTAVAVEARAGDDGGPRRIGGYAAKFDVLSRNLGGFVEKVGGSFFDKSRGDGWPDVMARYNHDDNMLLGTTAGRTLRLSVDKVGLVYEVDLPAARADVFELVERGDVQKSSFAFRVPPEGDEWTLDERGFPLRVLHTGQLVDVAAVNMPAYADTSTGVRTLVDPTVALRSLALKAEAPLDVVVAAAATDELRRFLTVTGSVQPLPKPKMFGASAAADLLSRREDPYV